MFLKFDLFHLESKIKSDLFIENIKQIHQYFEHLTVLLKTTQ